MSVYDEYLAKWAGHKSRGPIAPFGPHHEQNRRWRGFEALCDRAQARGVRVMLTATARLVVKTRDRERRDLYEIALQAGGNEIASEPIRSGDLDACAATLRPVLTS